MASGSERLDVAFDLDSSGLIAGARAGVVSLEQLQESLAADTEEVKNLQQAMRLMKGASSGGAETLDEMNKRLKAAKNSMAGAAGQIIKMNGELYPKKQAGGKAALPSQLKAVGSEASKAREPLSGFSNVAKELGVSMGRGGLVGAMLAAGAAVAAFPGLVTAATASLTRLALGFADARREEMILIDGMTRMRHWWGFVPGKAGDVRAAIDSVSNSTVLARDKIASYSQQLYKSGLRGGDLSAALEAVSIKASVQGEDAAQAFLGMALSARILGGSVQKMSATVKARLGDLSERQVIGFGNQIRKLKENMGQLFDTVNIDPFLKSMRSVTELFSMSSVNGVALQSAIGRIFSVILGGSASSGNAFRDMVRGITIGILGFSNNIKRLEIRWILFRNSIKSNEIVNTLKLGFTTAKLFEGVLVGIVSAAAGITIAFVAAGALIGAIAGIGTAITGVQAVLVGAAVAVPAAIVGILVAPFYLGLKAVNSLRANFRKGGRAIVQGIIDGIRDDFEAAKNAITGLGDSLSKWFRASLGIKSPSRVFRADFANIPKGAAMGIKDKQRAPRMAVQEMVHPEHMGQPQLGGRGGLKIEVGGIHIQSNGDACDLESRLEVAVSAIFERAAIQMGVA